MDERGFREFLSQKTFKGVRYTEKSVASRMTKAKKAENILESSFDLIVADDKKMYDALIELQKHEDPAHNLMQNALRKYYIFKNGKEFPQKKEYREKHL